MKHLLLFTITIFITTILNAQSPCAAAEMQRRLMEEQPEIRAFQEDTDEQIRANTVLAARGPQNVLTLPVVVHIIHQNGSENISDAQVLKALEYLNQAFAHAGPYAQAGPGVNTNIQFCLAQRTPDQMATNGITRSVSPLTDMTVETDNLTMKNISRWDPNQYINIWVVRSINSLSVGAGVAGYAYLASAHGSDIDGLVLEAGVFGTNPDQSKHLVHEMGHYLNLYHTFEGGCQNDLCDSQGDRVCDTAPDQAQSGGCVFNSCTTDADDTRPINPLSSDVNDPTQNYMDYSPPSCQIAFTPGQALRMRATVEGRRKSLLESLACLPPCTQPLSAEFSVPSQVGTGEPVVFQYIGSGATIFEWRVDGVVVSNVGAPVHIFTTKGKHLIELEVGNTDPNCRAYAAMEVLVLCNIKASIIPGDTLIDPGQSLLLQSVNSGASQLEWSVEGLVAGTGDALFYTFNESRNYLIRLQASNAWCSSIVYGQVRLREACNDSIEQYLYLNMSSGRTYATPNGGQFVINNGVRFYQIAPDGSPEWRSARTGVSSGLVAAGIFPNGNILIAYDASALPSRIGVELLAPDGTQLWARRYKNRAVRDLVVNPDGTAVLLTDEVMAKIDPAGNVLWSRASNGFSNIERRNDGGYNCAFTINNTRIFAQMDDDGDIIKQVKLNSIIFEQVQHLWKMPDDGLVGLLKDDDQLIVIRLGPELDLRWAKYFQNLQQQDFYVQTNDLGDVLIGMRTAIDMIRFTSYDQDGFFRWSVNYELIQGDYLYPASSNNGEGWLVPHSKGSDATLLRLPTRESPEGCSFTEADNPYLPASELALEPAAVVLGDYNLQWESYNPTNSLSGFSRQLICLMPVPCKMRCGLLYQKHLSYLFPDTLEFQLQVQSYGISSFSASNTATDAYYFGGINTYYAQKWANKIDADFITNAVKPLNNSFQITVTGVIRNNQHYLVLVYEDVNNSYSIFKLPQLSNGFNKLIKLFSHHKYYKYLVAYENGILCYRSGFISDWAVKLKNNFLLEDIYLNRFGRAIALINFNNARYDFTLLNTSGEVSNELQLYVNPQIWRPGSIYLNGKNEIRAMLQVNESSDSFDCVFCINPDDNLRWAKRIATTGNKSFAAYCNDWILYLNYSSDNQYFMYLIDPEGDCRKAYKMVLPAGAKISQVTGSDIGWIVPVSVNNSLYQLVLPQEGPVEEDCFFTQIETPQFQDISLMLTNNSSLPFTQLSIQSLVSTNDDLNIEAINVQMDVVCTVTTPCPEICDNTLDDDNDGLADCFDPDCNCLPCTLPDASAQIDSIWCADGHTKVQVRICNTGQSLLRADWPLQFSNGNGQVLSPLLTANLEIAPDNCVLQEYILDNPPTDLLRVRLNPAASAPFEECDYSNNSAERAFAPPPSGTPDLGPDQTLCNANTLTLQAPGGFVAYQWQDGSTESSYTAPGPGLYWLNAQDVCGAWHSDTIRLLLTPAGEIELGAERRICRGDTLHLQVEGFDQLRWWPEAGLSCADCPAPVFKPDSSGTLFVTALKGECLAADSLRIQVQDYAIASVADLALDCFVPSVELVADISQPNTILRWYSPDGQLLMGDSPAVDIAGEYRLEMSDSSGLCHSDTLVTVSDRRVLPMTDLPEEQKICRGDSLQLFVLPQPDVRYLWNTGAEGPELWVHSAGLYRIEATFATCVGADSVRILEESCEQAFYLPNVFMPESGGTNGLYLPGFSPFMEVLEYRLEIYDRWGELLFRTTDSAQGWDGRSRGRAMQPGVYVAVLVAKVLDQARVLEVLKSTDVLLVR